MAAVKPHVIESREQDPADVLDYSIDWKAEPKPFLKGTMVIITSTWAAYDAQWQPTAGVILTDQGHDDTTSTVRVSALTDDSVYATCHGVASDGQEKDQSILIKKKQH